MDQKIVDHVLSWANRGTMRQFLFEAEAKMASEGYDAEMEGETLTFFRQEKEGGILGIGGNVVREPVAVFREDDRGMIRLDDGADAEFLETLASELDSH